MATAAALRAIEDDCPWVREDFQAGLAALGESTAEEARRFARDMLARLALEGHRAVQAEAEHKRATRVAALHRYAGAAAGSYGDSYLERLRDEWPR